MDNEFITQGETVEFNRAIIQKRGVIKARYWSWKSFRVGLVIFINKSLIRVLFLTDVHASKSYYEIKIEEVQAGLWEIIFSPDMETFYKINIDDDDIDLSAGIRKLFEGDDPEPVSLTSGGSKQNLKENKTS